MSSSDAIRGSRVTHPEAPKPIPQQTTANQSQLYNKTLQCERACKGINLRSKVRNFADHCKQTLESGKTFLDRLLPNNRLQLALDDFGKKIEELLQPASAFNDWLKSSGHGQWHQKLCIWLLKAPLRLVAKVIQIVYGTIKCIAYSAVHPLKALIEFAKVFVEFIYSLTESITYTKMGAGTIGASLAQAALSGGFGVHAYIGLAIGGGLLVIGMLWGTIEAAITAEKGQILRTVANEFWQHSKAIPISLIVGFLFALVIGAVSIGLQTPTPQGPPISSPDIPFSKAKTNQTGMYG